ncbi:glycosyltransferase [Algoriphagus halophytocola]|uniref:Glycosyltransferase n=1 Tax=Algoriphagus halophytocola TaxID=2991499 RepID=A0ABY6MJG5_9BACT|nr:glycosyltransferase [Algoriphagus sp. TR-M5]UZD23933.1 glycosyltransferase [Algoriphagus sp. TR-M5]
MSIKNAPKILYTLDTLSLGGAELSVLELVKNLKGFEIYIAVIYRAKHGLRPDFESLGVRLYFLDIPHRFGFGKSTKMLKNLIKEIQPDLIHATHFRTEVISRLAVFSTSIPLIGTLISDTYSKDRYALVSQRERIKLELYKWLNRLTAFRSDLFISVSKAIVEPNKRYLWIRDSKIKVIPNGRDISLYANAQPYPREIFFPTISPGDKILFSNSRVIKSKGFEEIFQAFKYLNDKNAKVYLLVIGDGLDLPIYQRFCEENVLTDRVLFLGNRLDMAPLLKTADIFWFASHYEGSPGVVIEGMLSQIPIISSDIPTVTENLMHEHNALLFKKGDWNDLAEKTKFMIANWEIKGNLVNNAFDLALDKFDIKSIAKQHEDIYHQLLANP